MFLQCRGTPSRALTAARRAQEPVRVQIFTEQCAVIGDPALMARVLSSNLQNYGKDLDFSYSPFIVRALRERAQRQRLT